MDPNATLELLLQAITEHRWSDAKDHASDLDEWLTKRGAYPAPTDGYSWCRMVEALINTVEQLETNK